MVAVCGEASSEAEGVGRERLADFFSFGFSIAADVELGGSEAEEGLGVVSVTMWLSGTRSASLRVVVLASCSCHQPVSARRREMRMTWKVRKVRRIVTGGGGEAVFVVVVEGEETVMERLSGIGLGW
jgi:hypothetical protein